MGPLIIRLGKLVICISTAVIAGGASLWVLLQWKKSTQRQLRVRQRKEGEVHVISSSVEWEEFYPKLRQHCDRIKVVGFDCEWVAGGHRRPVSLVQIATQHGLCLLVRIYRIHMLEGVPRSFAHFLSDQSILKVGVAVKEDGRKLYSDYGLPVCGCVDLRHVVTRLQGLYEHRSNFGLQGLAKGVLGLHLDKDPSIRCGNWESSKLSVEQVEYAASDAYVAVDILTRLVLIKMSGKMVTTPSQTPNINVSETDFWKSTRSLCQGIVDVPYHIRKKHTKSSSVGHHSVKDQNGQPEMLECVESENRSFMVRQSPLYHNCRLLAPDGELMCTCSIKKAERYMQNGLADKINDNPLTLKLRFEPTSRPQSSTDYCLQDKHNVCVVCGAGESYIRKLIVPKEYKKYFPRSFKDFSSHDVLLLCPHCYQFSTQHDSVLRQQLAEEYSAPLECGESLNHKSVPDHDLQRVRSAAKALLTNGTKLPENRAKELKSIVKDFYGISSLSDDILEKAASIDPRVANLKYIPHGQKVADYLREHGLFLEFEKRWRQHFLDTMQPKFMPKHWVVDHKPEQLPRKRFDKKAKTNPA